MRDRGVTLLELLIVLAIIAVLTGMGLAVMSRSDKQMSFSGTRGAMISLIRYARSAAITKKLSTRVVIEPVTKQMYCLIPQTVGLWHFEDNQNGVTTGALGCDGKLSAGVLITSEGKYGKALLFDKGGVVDCGRLLMPRDAESLRNGVVLDAWVYPEVIEDEVILERSDDISLALHKDGRLSGRLGGLTVTTPGTDTVPIQGWSHIRLCYQNDILALLVNHKLVAQVTGVTELSSICALTVSSNTFPFKGKIDEVSIGFYSKVDVYCMQPEDITAFDVRLVGSDGQTGTTAQEGPIIIQFDDQGQLVQPVGPIRYASESAKDAFEVAVTFSGTVSVK